MKIDIPRFLTYFLLPLSAPYMIAVAIRNMLFNQEILVSHEFNIPIISVGNITVGGTGKTPHVEYLIELLKKEYGVATLSRGYKRKTHGFILADKNSTASTIGDEPMQFNQKYPEVSVAVDARRVHGIHELLKLEKTDVILLDDAFQHRYVKPGKSILLIDYNRLITHDLPLPAGRLREPVSSKRRADFILITKSPPDLKPIEMRNIAKSMKLGLHQHLFFTTIDYKPLKPVFDLEEPKQESWFISNQVPLLIISGIANPIPLINYAHSISTSISELRFPDHHYYNAKDMEEILLKFKSLDNPNTLILTTEKDAMRLMETVVPVEIKNALYYVPIQVRFLNNDRDEFNTLILRYVRSNKRNNHLYQKAN